MNHNFYERAAAHTIQSWINQQAEQAPDSVFFIAPEDGRTVTYRRLAQSLKMMGGRLKNVPQTQSVGIMAANGWATTQLLLGAPYHNRMALILNLTAGDSQLVYMLNHSDCRLVFADENNLSRLQSIVRQCDNAIDIVPVNRQQGIQDSHDDTPPPLTADEAALLTYTSGTTGAPKGVVHTHRSLLYSGANTASAHQLSFNDRALCVLPLFHINGQCVTVMAPLISGGSVVMPERLSIHLFWSWIQKHQCTWFSVVPTIISHLLHSEHSPPPLSHLRFGRSASSALAPQIHQQFEKRFAISLIETMGLTETAAQILSNPPPPQKGKYGSPGVAVGNKVYIVDKNGDAVPPDVEGEIAIQGANVMRGYLGHPPLSKDQLFMTGDLGKMDKDGYVFVTGRLKELIIKGGENIAPKEIDEALYTAPEVIEAAAFGVDCDIYGQQPQAAVVLDKTINKLPDESALIAVCESLIGKFKSPNRIHFLSELPKGPSGKIQRIKLVELLSDKL